MYASTLDEFPRPAKAQGFHPTPYISRCSSDHLSLALPPEPFGEAAKIDIPGGASRSAPPTPTTRRVPTLLVGKTRSVARLSELLDPRLKIRAPNARSLHAFTLPIVWKQVIPREVDLIPLPSLHARKVPLETGLSDGATFSRSPFVQTPPWVLSQDTAHP